MIMMCTCACIQFTSHTHTHTCTTAVESRRKSTSREFLTMHAQDWMRTSEVRTDTVRIGVLRRSHTHTYMRDYTNNQNQNKCLVDFYGRTKFIYPIDFNCRIHSLAHTHTQNTQPNFVDNVIVVVGPFLCVQPGSMQSDIYRLQCLNAHARTSHNHSLTHTHTHARKIRFWCFLGLLTCYILYGFWNLPLERINDTVNHIESRRENSHTHSQLTSQHSLSHALGMHNGGIHWNSHSPFVGAIKVSGITWCAPHTKNDLFNHVEIFKMFGILCALHTTSAAEMNVLRRARTHWHHVKFFISGRAYLWMTLVGTVGLSISMSRCSSCVRACVYVRISLAYLPPPPSKRSYRNLMWKKLASNCHTAAGWIQKSNGSLFLQSGFTESGMDF